ncbi:MAG: hypothetical protein V8Q17_06585 [Acutalibacteraceae bacterium]
MEKNKRTPARAKAEEEYLLTTKLFYGHCGRMMIGEEPVNPIRVLSIAITNVGVPNESRAATRRR